MWHQTCALCCTLLPSGRWATPASWTGRRTWSETRAAWRPAPPAEAWTAPWSGSRSLGTENRHERSAGGRTPTRASLRPRQRRNLQICVLHLTFIFNAAAPHHQASFKLCKQSMKTQYGSSLSTVSHVTTPSVFILRTVRLMDPLCVWWWRPGGCSEEFSSNSCSNSSNSFYVSTLMSSSRQRHFILSTEALCFSFTFSNSAVKPTKQNKSSELTQVSRKCAKLESLQRQKNRVPVSQVKPPRAQRREGGE